MKICHQFQSDCQFSLKSVGNRKLNWSWSKWNSLLTFFLLTLIKYHWVNDCDTHMCVRLSIKRHVVVKRYKEDQNSANQQTKEEEEKDDVFFYYVTVWITLFTSYKEMNMYLIITRARTSFMQTIHKSQELFLCEKKRVAKKWNNSSQS